RLPRGGRDEPDDLRPGPLLRDATHPRRDVRDHERAIGRGEHRHRGDDADVGVLRVPRCRGGGADHAVPAMADLRHHDPPARRGPLGEHPQAAETVGIDVIRTRYRNVILGGIFAGLAGAFLTLESQGHFQLQLTAGRGFIALAAVIVGRWTPLGALAAALLFAATDALRIAIGIAPPTGDLGTVFNVIPAQFYQALPYIVTIVVLAGFVGRSVAPAAAGP